jgi:hypothetical protein
MRPTFSHGILPKSSLLAALAIAFLASSALAQSGRAGLSGYVAFDGVAYVDKQPIATVELFSPDDKDRAHPLASAKTGEHGQYEMQTAALGEMIIRITAPNYTSSETTMYFPSDFQARIATLLKKAPPATTEKK